MGFVLCEKDGLKYFEIEEFSFYGVEAIFTTRHYKDSNTFNLSYKWCNNKSIVDGNFKTLFETLDIDYRNVCYVKQVHKDDIILVEKGFDFFNAANTLEADALLTKNTYLTLMTYHADCIPVYLFDKKKNIIGLIHSGWRGTIKRITKKAINMMISLFGCLPSDILVGIGPGICKDHFEVGIDVFCEFEKVFNNFDGFFDSNRYYIDLKEIIKKDALDCGIFPDNIVVCDECTYENQDLFYSFRRDRESEERLGGMVALIRMVRE